MGTADVGGAAAGSAGSTGAIRAIVLRGHYRGEPLVSPGEVIELSPREFAEARAANLVDYAPADPPPPPAGGGKRARP